MEDAYNNAAAAAKNVIKPAVDELLPLIPAEVSGVKLQEPITTWWNELFATPGNCEKCSLTVLYTLIEFMCLMAVPTMVGALIVLFAAFAPTAADMAIALMEEKVTLVGSKIPPAIPKPTVGPAIYLLFSFLLPMAPVIGPFCPLLLSIIMGAFGGRNIIEVTRSNAAPKTAAAAPSSESKTESKTESKSDGDAKKD